MTVLVQRHQEGNFTPDSFFGWIFFFSLCVDCGNGFCISPSFYLSSGKFLWKDIKKAVHEVRWLGYPFIFRACFVRIISSTPECPKFVVFLL